MPSVKQIEIDGVVYDFGGEGGFSDDAKSALITLLEKVAYVDTSGQAYLTDLYNKLFDNYWSITNTLSNASNSNSAQTVEKGSSYSATISASAGYTLTGATVSVTMNGADVTSSVYSNGTISIAEVTGDVVITVVAVSTSVELVSIEATYTQSGTVYTTDTLDSLKPDLVVIATYDDTSTEVVSGTDYTLSGTLTAGTSTITVTYEGKTDTFTVTVTANRIPSGYTEYEYISVNSNAGAIRTPAQLSTGYIVETAFGFTATSQGNPTCIFGTRNGGSGAKQFALFVTATNKKVGYWINGTDTANTYNLAVGGGAKNTVVYKPKGVDQTYPNNSTLTINGTVCDTGDASDTNVMFSSWFGFYKYQTSASASAGTNYNIGLRIG